MGIRKTSKVWTVFESEKWTLRYLWGYAKHHSATRAGKKWTVEKFGQFFESVKVDTQIPMGIRKSP